MRSPLSLVALPIVLLLPAAGAHAQQQAVLADAQAALDNSAYARLPVCTLGADGRSLAVEPCRTAPARTPMPRRPVPRQSDQHIGIRDTTPPQAVPQYTLPAATLHPHEPYPVPPRPPAAPTVNPSGSQVPGAYTVPAPGAYAVPPAGPTRPAPAACPGGACTDAAGRRYQGPANGVLTSPGGRPCTNTAGFISCM